MKTSKLIQLKLSKGKLEKYDKLVNMLGLSDTFGCYQRAIDIGIELALFTLYDFEKVLPDLETDKLDIFLSSIKELRKAHNKQKLLEQIAQKP
jgi:hypothetical protein